MSDPYTIVEVQQDWVLHTEEMGSKTKFWYRGSEEPQRDWLFKYPQRCTGQHWAEKIAEEVASVLRVTHARVELARFGGKRGSVTESFARGGRALDHGNQVLERVVHGYEPARKFNQSRHTLENIWQALDRIFSNSEASRLAKLSIAEYLVLDALIGNTDRHHENWGILRRRVGDAWKARVAPSFDHASSLGRELLDEHRDRFLAEDRVGGYAEKGRGAIYWSEDDKHAPSPLELVRRAARCYPCFFLPALLKLEKLDTSAIRGLVSRIPCCWMSTSARAFAIALMDYNLEQLRRHIT